MKKIVVLISLCSVLQFLHAATEPAWSIKFDKPVNWQRVTNLGYLIVNTGDGLFGINPESGEKLWMIKELGNMPEDSYQQMPGTQFFKMERIVDNSLKVDIINPVDGRILFNTDKENVKTLLSYHTLVRSNQLLVVAIKNENTSASLLMYDIESASKVWDNDELFKIEVETGIKGNFGAFANALASQMGSSMNARGLTSEPVELDENTLLLVHPNFVYSVSSHNGQLNWKQPIESSTLSAVYFKEDSPDVVFVSTEKEETSQSSSTGETIITYYNPIYAINLKTGQPVWEKAFISKGKLNLIIMDERGMIVCPRDDKSVINLLDYGSGVGQWGKKGNGVKIKGSIITFEKIGDQYAVTTGFDNAFTNAGEEYYLNVLDPTTGMMKFEKYEKLSGDLRQTQMLEKGMLYITSREVNILDLNTGLNLFDKSVESAKPIDPDKYDPVKHGLPICENETVLYVYSSKDNVLYEVDKKLATVKPLTGKIEFEEKEEPSRLELAEDGILLMSDQNIMKVDMNGNTLYHSYFPAPKLPGLLRALHAANAIRAAYYSLGTAAYSAAFAAASTQTDDALTQEITEEMSEGFADLTQQGVAITSQSANMVFKRFKASAVSPDFVFVLSEPERKHYYLYQVSKADGEKKQEIDLAKDREPSYEVDEVYNYIYYRLGDNEIVCYHFK